MSGRESTTFPKSSSPLANATPAQCMALWGDLMNACDALLRAGLVREGGDWKAAYREWHHRRREEHLQMWAEVARRLSRQEPTQDGG
jgi:hypothetical protein